MSLLLLTLFGPGGPSRSLRGRLSGLTQRTEQSGQAVQLLRALAAESLRCASPALRQEVALLQEQLEARSEQSLKV